MGCAGHIHPECLLTGCARLDSAPSHPTSLLLPAPQHRTSPTTPHLPHSTHTPRHTSLRARRFGLFSAPFTPGPPPAGSAGRHPIRSRRPPAPPVSGITPALPPPPPPPFLLLPACSRSAPRPCAQACPAPPRPRRGPGPASAGGLARSGPAPRLGQGPGRAGRRVSARAPSPVQAARGAVLPRPRHPRG